MFKHLVYFICWINWFVLNFFYQYEVLHIIHQKWYIYVEKYLVWYGFNRFQNAVEIQGIYCSLLIISYVVKCFISFPIAWIRPYCVEQFALWSLLTYNLLPLSSLSFLYCVISACVFQFVISSNDVSKRSGKNIPFRIQKTYAAVEQHLGYLFIVKEKQFWLVVFFPLYE